MKGIILAGGAGSRLYPLTLTGSKQLQPVYDKPMIYYPLCTLMQGGIRDILIISTPHDLPRFEQLLGSGRQWGIKLSYLPQPAPEGIAQAFLIGADFIGGQPVTLILGDNIFYGNMQFRRVLQSFSDGALVFGYFVKDPARYGVVEFDGDRVLGIEEKPEKPKSHYAVPGLYVFDEEVVRLTENLQLSARGELEITDLNMEYLKQDRLRVELMDQGITWLDSGTHTSLLEAANFIATIQTRQGRSVACLEETALDQGFIDRRRLDEIIASMPNSSYREYLVDRFQSD